jgi:hypothetical protein
LSISRRAALMAAARSMPRIVAGSVRCR